MNKNNHSALIKAAIKSFWETKQKQLTASGDSSNRGAVVGGKQLDAFADLLKELAIEQGVPEECNFNNRAEESIGSAVDLWTAFRENQFPGQAAPWIGYLTVVGKDEGSINPVRNNEPHYPVLPEFKTASYLDRYRILCQKLILERHYSMAALVSTSGPDHYEDVSEDTSIEKFIRSFIGHLVGNIHEFQQ